MPSISGFLARLRAYFPLIGLCIGVIGCLILFRKIIGPDINSRIWADGFDGNLVVWIFEWGFHALFKSGTPWNFWNANSFYPYADSLAFSESILSGQLFYGPLRLLGLAPLPALYLTLAGFTVLGCVLSDAALKLLNVTPLERAVIIVGAHFGLPLSCFLYHYQIFGFELAPPFFLFLFYYLQTWQAGSLIIVSIIFVLAVCFSTYLAPMLMLLSLPLVMPVLIRELKEKGIGNLVRRIGWRGPAASLVLLVILNLVQLQPYILLSKSMPRPSFDDAAAYSAKFASLFKGFSLNSYWYAPSGYGDGDWERAYFPGLVLLVPACLLFMMFIVAKVRRGRSRLSCMLEGKQRTAVPYRNLVNASIVLFFTALVLSWGPYGRWHMPLPFWFAGQILPAIRNVRTPGRFGAFIGLPLSVLLIAFVKLTFTRQSWQRAAMALAFIALCVDSLPNHRVDPFAIPRPDVYRELGHEIAPGTPLLELPVAGGDHYATMINIMNQLKGSTLYWGRLVVGYGAKSTPECEELLEIDSKIIKGEAAPIDAVKFAKKLKISEVLIDMDKLRPEISRKWLAMAYDKSAVSSAQRIKDSLLLHLL